jgi:nitrilase
VLLRGERDRPHGWIYRASERVFEALLGGYPRGATFGAVIGERSPAGREEFAAYSRQAVTLPGPELDEVASIAARHGLPSRFVFLSRNA